jgi:hypothetical protein
MLQNKQEKWLPVVLILSAGLLEVRKGSQDGFNSTATAASSSEKLSAI